MRWLRDYDSALQQASQSGRPILLQFQEVPGCSTCVNYGRDSLSHPLMVELIEQHFVPLAIFNNHPGDDARILSKGRVRQGGVISAVAVGHRQAALAVMCRG